MADVSSSISFDIIARDKASSTFSKIGSVSERTQSRLGKFAKAAAVGLGGLGVSLGAVGLMGLKTAAANEQAQIAFTTMLGSAKKARSFLGDLQKFAAKTPFEFPELQTAASSLISAGINAKQVIPIMTTLGDVTSGMGTGAEGVQRATIALQQMNAAGRITGEDLNQLRDAGVPVYDLLSKATGKSKAEVVALAQAGKLGSKELGQMMKALETGKGLKRFSGLMDKQSQSLSGMVSTLKDTFGQGLATALAPAMPTIKKAIGGATQFVAVAIPALGRFAQWFKTNVIPPMRAAAAFISTDVIPAFQRIGAAFDGVGRSGTRTGAALTQFKANFASIFASVKSIMTSVSGFAQVFWAKYGDLITKYGIGTLRNLLTVVRGVMNIITGIFKTVAAVLRGDWGGAWDGVKQITKGAVQVIRGAVGQLWNTVKSLFAAGGPALKNLMGLAWDGVKSAVMAGIHAEVRLIASIPGRITGAIGDLSGLLVNAGKAVVQGLINGVKTMIKPLTDTLHAITNLIPKHKGPEDKDRKLLHPAGRAIMEGLLAGIESKKLSLKKALSKITDMVQAAGEKLSGLQDIKSGFLSTFSSDSIFGADLSGGGGIDALIAFEQNQAAKASQLLADVQKVASMGLSKSLISQLQSAGSSGADQLHALAGGTGAQIAQLNALDVMTSSSLQAAGMAAGNYGRGGSIDADIARAARQEQLLTKILEELKHVGDAVITVEIDGEGVVTAVKKRNKRKGVKTAGI